MMGFFIVQCNPVIMMDLLRKEAAENTSGPNTVGSFEEKPEVLMIKKTKMKPMIRRFHVKSDSCLF